MNGKGQSPATSWGLRYPNSILGAEVPKQHLSAAKSPEVLLPPQPGAERTVFPLGKSPGTAFLSDPKKKEKMDADISGKRAISFPFPGGDLITAEEYTASSQHPSPGTRAAGSAPG